MPGFLFLEHRFMSAVDNPRTSTRKWSRWKEETAAAFALSWPIILTNLTHMAIMTTDIVFLGWYSPKALAAATLATGMMHMMVAIGFGLSMATAPLMANAIGRRLRVIRSVRRTVRQGLWACWLYCLPAWVVLWHGRDLFLLAGQDPDLAQSAGDYLHIVQWLLFPLFGFSVLRFFTSALGRPAVTLMVTVAGIGANILGNYALVFGHFGLPRMGMTGSALSTIFASALLFLGLLAFCLLDRRFRRYALLGRFFRADWPRFVELWKIGLPIGVTTVMEGMLFFGSTFIVGLFGADTLAAHAIVLQICGIAFMVPMGLSEAATIRVGFWAGRGSRDDVALAGWVTLGLGIAVSLLSALVMLVFPEQVAALFVDPADPMSDRVIELAAQFLVLAGLFQVADSIQFIAAGALRGLKDTRAHMLFILTGHLVLAFPCGAMLALWTDLHGTGIWIGFLIGLVIVAALVLARWTRRDHLRLFDRCRAHDEAMLGDGIAA
jgi:MATE family multidrug resistance protein